MFLLTRRNQLWEHQQKNFPFKNGKKIAKVFKENVLAKKHPSGHVDIFFWEHEPNRGSFSNQILDFHVVWTQKA